MSDLRAVEKRIGNAVAEAVRLWGAEAQWRMVQEECAELIVAVNHRARGRIPDAALAEEVADVIIAAAQARYMLGGLVEEIMERKLSRLEGRLAAAGKAGIARAATASDGGGK